MAFGDSLRRFWGMITPGQTAWEREQGLAGTWGSGDYQVGGAGQYDPAGNIIGGSAASVPDPGVSLEEAQAALAPYHEQLGEISGKIGEMPTFTEWLETKGESLVDPSSQIEGIGGLISRLEDTDANFAASQDYAGQMLGMGDAEGYQTMVADLLARGYGEDAYDLAGGISGEERDLRERAIRRNSAEMERRATRMLQDSMADNGSTARMLVKADEFTSQIANTEIQQQAQLASDDAERRLQQVASAQQGWAQAVQAGTMTASNYIQQLETQLGMAMEGYAQQVSMIMTQNQTYLQQYQADYNALANQIEAMFTATQMEMGLTLAEYDLASEIFASELAPILAELEIDIMELETTFGLDDIMDILGLGVEALGLL